MIHAHKKSTTLKGFVRLVFTTVLITTCFSSKSSELIKVKYYVGTNNASNMLRSIKVPLYRSDTIIRERNSNKIKLYGINNEFKYYQNGKLNYKGTIVLNKRIGSLLWYLPSGELHSYSAFDVDENPFCIFHYDSKLKIIKMEGIPFSPKFYSINKANNSVTKLIPGKIDEGVQDLFIVVATPPTTNTYLTVNINNIKYEYRNTNIDNGILKIAGVFHPNRTYKIAVRCKIYDSSNKLINAINIEENFNVR